MILSNKGIVVIKIREKFLKQWHTSKGEALC